jgi:hypothetical protein
MVVCTAMDESGNSSTCSFKVTVEESGGPTMSCPRDIIITCDDSVDPSNTGLPTTADFCDASPMVTFSDAVEPGELDGDCDVDLDDLALLLTRRNTPATGPDDPFDLDRDGRITVLDARKLALLFRNSTTITRTWTATDTCGNTRSCVQLITRH